MMKVTLIWVLFVGVIIAGTCNAAPLNTDEKEARAFVQRANSKMLNYYNKMSQQLFDTIDENPGEVMLTTKIIKTLVETAKQTAQIVDEAKQFDYSKFTDPELKYIFKILRKSAHEAVLADDKLMKMYMALKMLQDLASDKDILSYQNKSIELAYFPDVQDIFAKSDDPEELKYYWTAWRQRNGAWASINFARLVNSVNESARLNELTPLEMWLDENNITEMENVMMKIEPLYIQLHGFARKQLHKKYGDLVIKPNGYIPHHLFEQVLAQAWTSGSIIDDMYPYTSLPPYDAILEQNHYNTIKMFKMADQFYQSMGFNPIPDEYWGNNFKMNTDEDEGDCKALIFDKSYNIYMHYCRKMDFRKFLQAHGYMGEVYYAREKSNLPLYYFDSYNLKYPIGEAVILSASTPSHLKSIGLVTEFRFTDEVKMNRLLRMGIHTLLNVPVYFVHTKVIADLFSGSVDIADLNKHYWQLMEKYVGVTAPVERSFVDFDFPFKFYTELKDNKQASKFMTAVLGYQFYEKLCEISGKYARSTKSEPIHNCDFYGSKKAGDALKNMMRLGSSKPMREVLSTMFPEDPSANADSLMKYYSPMKSWLIEQNRENNVIVGWTHSD